MNAISLACWRENDFEFLTRRPGLCCPSSVDESRVDIQQIFALVVLYCSAGAYAAITTIFFDPEIVGYTIAMWLLVGWSAGLGIWEYIGRKHEARAKP